MGKGSIAGLMLCFTVSMLKARLSNCATDKMLQCGTEHFICFMCGRKTSVAFLYLKLHFQIYVA